VREALERTDRSIILYDADLLEDVSDKHFNPGSWESASTVTGTFKSGGRGNTLFVTDGGQDFVLRRYLRGGLIGLLVRDNYLWSGEYGNRAFSEWRLLAKLAEAGLPVPRPAAARVRKSGPFYKAELLTVRLPGIQSLSDRVTAAPTDKLFWSNFGKGIHRFHEAGVFHPDLNVSNCQFDGNDEFWLLDFDRGKLLPAGTWRQRNLARLHRSLRKLKRFDSKIYYNNACWNQLLEGYFKASRSA